MGRAAVKNDLKERVAGEIGIISDGADDAGSDERDLVRDTLVGLEKEETVGVEGGAVGRPDVSAVEERRGDGDLGRPGSDGGEQVHDGGEGVGSDVMKKAKKNDVMWPGPDGVEAGSSRSSALSLHCTVRMADGHEQRSAASGPPPFHRCPSYSKRHASFNSPREVPLPSPTADIPDPFDDDSARRARYALFPLNRPFSLPTPSNQLPDRSSSASLPNPSQIPFHALPPHLSCPSLDQSPSSSSSSSAPLSPPPVSPTALSLPDKPSLPSTPPTPPTPPRIPPESPPRSFVAPTPSALSSFPPPDPPLVLPQAAPDDLSQLSSRSAPYVPFLSHAPPPPDCWIDVETLPSEYKLHVRLPGFSRESITLATKRRRILHLVADSWGNGGGHFERRISFGYDADLVQVRAEFDGLMLRVSIPRRTAPVSWSSVSPGLSGSV